MRILRSTCTVVALALAASACSRSGSAPADAWSRVSQLHVREDAWVAEFGEAAELDGWLVWDGVGTGCQLVAYSRYPQMAELWLHMLPVKWLSDAGPKPALAPGQMLPVRVTGWERLVQVGFPADPGGIGHLPAGISGVLAHEFVVAACSERAGDAPPERVGSIGTGGHELWAGEFRDCTFEVAGRLSTHAGTVLFDVESVHGVPRRAPTIEVVGCMPDLDEQLRDLADRRSGQPCRLVVWEQVEMQGVPAALMAQVHDAQPWRVRRHLQLGRIFGEK